MTHLSCDGDAIYDWSTGLIFKNGRYFDPSLGIWLSLVLPALLLAPLQRRRRRHLRDKKRIAIFILLMLLIALAGCGAEPPTEPNCDPDEPLTLYVNMVTLEGGEQNIHKYVEETNRIYNQHLYSWQQDEIVVIPVPKEHFDLAKTREILKNSHPDHPELILPNDDPFIIPNHERLIYGIDNAENGNISPRYLDGKITAYFVPDIVPINIQGIAFIEVDSVAINNTSQLPRQYETLAHEIGHILLGPGHNYPINNFMASGLVREDTQTTPDQIDQMIEKIKANPQWCQDGC